MKNKYSLKVIVNYVKTVARPLGTMYYVTLFLDLDFRIN